MARYLPLVAEAVGYALISAGAFLTDPHLGLAVVGFVLLWEAREATRS